MPVLSWGHPSQGRDRPLSSSDKIDTRAAILRNARAARWEGLLNQVDPTGSMPDDERAAKARELQRQQLSAAGRAGRQSQIRAAEEARQLRLWAQEIEDRLQNLLDDVRAGRPGDPDEPQAPVETAGAACGHCGADYASATEAGS